MTRARWQYPVWIPPPPERSQPSRATVNSASERVRRLPIAAEGSVIPVIYGQSAVSPAIFAAVNTWSFFYLGCAVCLGEIRNIIEFYDGDSPLSSNIDATIYVGETTQGIDPWLANAIPGYSDTLVFSYAGRQYGVAYFVLRIPRGEELPSDLKCVVRGRKVADPRQGSGVYYEKNPALALADFVSDPILGIGVPVNVASLTAAANYCDEDVGGKPRHEIELAITGQASVDTHLEALRTYANCWMYYDAGEIHLVPQRASGVVGAIDEDLILDGSLELQQMSAAEKPTVVTVEYTDRRSWPEVSAEVTVKHPDVDPGIVSWRESRISMPGIDNASEALRLATQRLNHFNVVDLQATLTGFDELLQYTVGDVVELTHSIGLSAKPMRVIGSAALAPGRWRLNLEEYDPAVYSNATQANPTFPDTNLPLPTDIPPVTGLDVVETVFQTDKGFASSRLSVTWDDMSDAYPYTHEYRIVTTITSGPGVVASEVIGETTTRGLEASTPPLQEAATYRVDVRVESAWGGARYTGPYTSAIIVAQGKQIPPGDVPEVRALEAAGEVYIEWDAALDIDIWRYELRYGPSGGDWDSATLLQRVDGLRHRTTSIPEGDWIVYAKAIDSTGQYSANAASVAVSVTFDPGRANVARHDYVTGETVVNMTPVDMPDGSRCWVTDSGATWNAALTNNLATYTDPLVAYTGAVASSWTSEIKAWGYDIDGNWSMPKFDASLAEGGPVSREMQLQDPFDAWQGFPALSATGIYKASRAHASASPGETLIVCIPTVRIELSSAPKSQSGSGVFSAPGPATVTLPYAANALTSIQITPTGGGATPRYGVADNIVLGENPSFDVYIFDTGGGLSVNSDFFWEFRGI